MRFILAAMCLASLAGCDAAPEVLVCLPVPYTADTLIDCGCGLSGPSPGLLTALVAAPGSFVPREPITVLHAGESVAQTRAAADGSLALAVLVPGGSASALDLVVEFRRDQSLTLHLPDRETAFVTGDLTFVETEPGVLHYAALTRALEWIDCMDPIAPTPAPSRIFAANLTTGSATVDRAAALDTPWDVQVPGDENDLAIVVVEHVGGGISGCFQSFDICCDCPSGPGGAVALHAAHCTPELRASGMCEVRGGTPLDAGFDSGPLPGVDAYHEPEDAGPRPDMGPPS